MLLLTSLWVRVCRRHQAIPNAPALNQPLGFHELSYMRPAQLTTAKFCIHCKSPIDSTSSSTINCGGERDRAKPGQAAGSFFGRSSGSAGASFRIQLAGTTESEVGALERKYYGYDFPRSEMLKEDFRQRVFVRPGSPDSEVETDASVRPVYHPLAEKALEKIDRVKASSAENTPGDYCRTEFDSPGSPEPEVLIRRRRLARRSEKAERIEIDLNQPTLPFDSSESPVSTSREDQIQKGLSAAALAPRVRAGIIDALFIFGCFLIFLLIVFFVPEFALFSRSSMLGMGSVFLLIFLSYIGAFTTLGARTLGMDHEHLEVVSYQGNPITAHEARLRPLAILFPLDALALVFCGRSSIPEQLTWHDKISRTLVVHKPSNSDPLP